MNGLLSGAGVVLVNNAAISAAIRDVYDETRTVLEAAGALSVAGARAYLKKHNIEVHCISLPHGMCTFGMCTFGMER